MPSAAGLYYFAHGAELLTLPPVILIHGAGGHHLYWPAQVRRLHGERVFALDLPGHGKSAGVGHHAVRDYSAEVLAFMDAMKFSRAVLVGHSMGGAIALQAALDAPERMLGLGLLGSAARLRVSPVLLQSSADPSKAEETVRTVIENSFAPTTSARLQELAQQRMAETRSSVLYGDFLACEEFDPGPGVAQIDVPVLMIFGKDDRMVPVGAGRLLAQQLKQARLEVVEGAGHMVMLEQPDIVAALLIDFLKGIRYQPGE